MRWPACIAFGVMHAACSSSNTAPDATTVDAQIGGLSIELVAKGGVPQMVGTDVEITRMVLGAANIRAIGDAAPGDLRTTRTAYVFEWRDNLMPIPLLFRDAPPGVYSELDLHVVKSVESADALNITGRALHNGTLVPFEIDSNDIEVPVSVTISGQLAPRTITTLTIEVDVASLVDDVDWDAVPLTTDGKLFIGDTDAQMSNVVPNLTGAFKQR